MKPVFITGIGTDVGKTVVSAVVAIALEADYWKPVQAGFTDGTDREWISVLLKKYPINVHPELYKFELAASPHIAARDEGKRVDLDKIVQTFYSLPARGRFTVVEGAGGLLVPLNESQFVIDLVKALDAPVILVSRNYLGSINHSLLTAAACKQRGLNVLGWVFNDDYLDYHQEIADWTGYPVLGKIAKLATIDASALEAQAILLKQNLLQRLEKC